MRRWLEAHAERIAWLLALALVAAAIAFYCSLPCQCYHYAYQHCAKDGICAWFARLVNDPIALFTAALTITAVWQIGLWVSSNSTAERVERMLARSERPYLSPTHVAHVDRNQVAGGDVLNIQFNNIGKEHAIATEIRIAFEFIPMNTTIPMPSEDVFARAIVRPLREVAGPNGFFWVRADSIPDLNRAHMRDVGSTVWAVARIRLDYGNTHGRRWHYTFTVVMRSTNLRAGSTALEGKWEYEASDGYWGDREITA